MENNNIVLTAGAAGSLDGLAWSLCDPGEGILVPCPYHAGKNAVLSSTSTVPLVMVYVVGAFANRGPGAYEVFLNIHTGVVPIPVSVGSLDDVFGAGMIPTLEKGLRDAPVPVKAVIVTNPHNPLGRCYSKENLIELMQFCQRHNLHLIADEVFALSEHGCSDLRQPRKFTSALAIDAAAHGCDASKIHVIWSMSKDLGATGARLVSFKFPCDISCSPVWINLPSWLEQYSFACPGMRCYAQQRRAGLDRSRGAYQRLESLHPVRPGPTHLPAAPHDHPAQLLAARDHFWAGQGLFRGKLNRVPSVRGDDVCAGKAGTLQPDEGR